MRGWPVPLPPASLEKQRVTEYKIPGDDGAGVRGQTLNVREYRKEYGKRLVICTYSLSNICKLYLYL